jgi:Ca2+/H+ antiporter
MAETMMGFVLLLSAATPPPRRVKTIEMLGSMLTNMLFVFGVACLIGGCRWQVQELRTTSMKAKEDIPFRIYR